MKLPTLIALYELLLNLASAKKLSELTFEGAKELLRNHLRLRPSHSIGASGTLLIPTKQTVSK